MASKAVAAAPEAISEESAKTQLADRPTETQAVVDTTHADVTTVGNAPSVAGESQQDAEHISHASTHKRGSQADPGTPDTPSSKGPQATKYSQALDSNASEKQFLVVPDQPENASEKEADSVTRQTSPNLVTLITTPPTFQSVSDFVDAYKQKDKTIADLTAEFAAKAGETKQKQDEILPHFAFMQSLLSKKGAN